MWGNLRETFFILSWNRSRPSMTLSIQCEWKILESKCLKKL